MAAIQVPPDSTGKKVDTVTLSDAGSEVHRQKMVITGGSGTAEIVVVTDTTPGASAMGLVVRPIGAITLSGTATVAGAVTISGTATVAGSVGISGFPSSLTTGSITASAEEATLSTPGANGIGLQIAGAFTGAIQFEVTIDNSNWVSHALLNKSTNTLVASASAAGVFIGSVGDYRQFRLRASAFTAGGTADYAINLTYGTDSLRLDGPLPAGSANIGTLNNISATVTVAGVVAMSGTATISGNVNISATAPVAGTLNISGSVEVSGAVGLFTTAVHSSASRGPRCVLASTSANVILASAPGAGLSIFVTQVAVTNASGTNTRARLGSSATPGNVTMMLAQSGGGFVMNFTPPWEISANEAFLVSVKPNVSEGIFNAHFFVGSSDSF